MQFLGSLLLLFLRCSTLFTLLWKLYCSASYRVVLSNILGFLFKGYQEYKSNLYLLWEIGRKNASFLPILLTERIIKENNKFQGTSVLFLKSYNMFVILMLLPITILVKHYIRCLIWIPDFGIILHLHTCSWSYLR